MEEKTFEQIDQESDLRKLIARQAVIDAYDQTSDPMQQCTSDDAAIAALATKNSKKYESAYARDVYIRVFSEHYERYVLEMQ